MALGVFHVEFGMNETPLTTALEQGNFASAERIILECPHASYLDDGRYQRTPLYICLCGVDEYHQKVTTRNFYLARLLIERGANINNRVPVTNFGSEYLSPGKSSLELLIDFYIELTRHAVSEYDPGPPWQCQPRQWNPLTELVVGLNRMYLKSWQDVRDDIQDLVFNILRHGGDVNVLDEHRSTPVHRVAMLSHDLSILKLLCNNGAQMYAVDIYGNTPLLSLCSITGLEGDSLLDDLSPQSEEGGEDFQEELKRSLRVKTDFLTYLLKLKETDINHQNNQGQTALFHCIQRGDMEAAWRLLEAGADPSLQGYVWESRRKKRKLSALFASFLSLPLQRSLLHSTLYSQLTEKPHPLAHLVDAGYFTTTEVIEELSSMINSEFPELSHLRPYCDSLIHLMFGYKSASLKQLAARKVFQTFLVEDTTYLHTILPVSSIQDSYQASDLLSNPQTYEEYMTLVLNSTVLRRLMELLQLPHSLLLHLEAQLLFHQMALKLYCLRVSRPAPGMDGEEDGQGSSSENDDDYSYESTSSDNVEGDSDLEYW